jgi:hypothetical protein
MRRPSVVCVSWQFRGATFGASVILGLDVARVTEGIHPRSSFPPAVGRHTLRRRRSPTRSGQPIMEGSPAFLRARTPPSKRSEPRGGSSNRTGRCRQPTTCEFSSARSPMAAMITGTWDRCNPLASPRMRFSDRHPGAFVESISCETSRTCRVRGSNPYRGATAFSPQPHGPAGHPDISPVGG